MKILTALLVSLSFVAGPAMGQRDIYIRGLRYTDLTQGTTLSANVVPPGGVLNVTLPRTFGNYLRAEVVLEDPSRGSGFGVTNFSLRNRTLRGRVVTAQVPTEGVFLNRTFHVAVFVFENGVSRFYASAGTIRIGTPPRPATIRPAGTNPVRPRTTPLRIRRPNPNFPTTRRVPLDWTMRPKKP